MVATPPSDLRPRGGLTGSDEASYAPIGILQYGNSPGQNADRNFSDERSGSVS